jgi:hypothetical protein
MKNTMKFLGVIALAAVIGLTAAACKSGGGASPSSAVRSFHTAVEKGDAKALEKVATSETAALMAMFGEKAKEGVTANGKIKSTTEKIDGDTAVVTVTYDNGETQDIDLVKEDGKWKVSISK